METQLHTFWEPASFIAGIFVGVTTWAVARKAINARFTPEQQLRWGNRAFFVCFVVGAFFAATLMQHGRIWTTVVGGIIFAAPMTFLWCIGINLRYQDWQLRHKR